LKIIKTQISNIISNLKIKKTQISNIISNLKITKLQNLKNNLQLEIMKTEISNMKKVPIHKTWEDLNIEQILPNRTFG
jgi:hypothetical protein